MTYDINSCITIIIEDEPNSISKHTSTEALMKIKDILALSCFRYSLQDDHYRLLGN
jgi:hypothetical protein